MPNIFINTNNKQMTEFFNIKSPNFLFGQNAQNLVIMAGIAFLVYKQVKK